MIIGAGFVANLDYMKLKQISEAGMSRRDFLGRSFGAALSASPLGRLLLGVGIQPVVAKSVLGGQAVPFLVFTGTHYGRGDIPSMDEQFEKVSQATGLIKHFGDFLGFGVDEDAYFTGRLQPTDFAKIIRALNNNANTVQIAGNKYVLYDDDETIGLEDSDGSGVYARIYKGEFPEYFEEQPVTGNPLVTWWKNYGSWGEEIIGPHAKQVLDELGLRRENEIGDEYELEDEEDEHEEEYDEKDEDVETTRPKWAKDPAASSMHQWFENKLNRALLGRKL